MALRWSVKSFDTGERVRASGPDGVRGLLSFELVFFGGGFVDAGTAVVEEFCEPGGGAPVGAAGLDDGEERLGDGIEAGFGDLLGELLVALEGVEDGDVMDAELGGGLAEGEAVGHEAEEATFGEVIEGDGTAAAERARGRWRRGEIYRWFRPRRSRRPTLMSASSRSVDGGRAGGLEVTNCDLQSAGENGAQESCALGEVIGLRGRQRGSGWEGAEGSAV